MDNIINFPTQNQRIEEKCCFPLLHSVPPFVTFDEGGYDPFSLLHKECNIIEKTIITIATLCMFVNGKDCSICRNKKICQKLADIANNASEEDWEKLKEKYGVKKNDS